MGAVGKWKKLIPLGMQIVRYGVNGAIANAILFLAFLVITHFGLDPKVALTITYFSGIPLSFVFHKKWTFISGGDWRREGPKFVIVYLSGWVLNWAGMYLLHDLLAWDYRLVQAAMILVVAAYLFCLQRWWVFARRETPAPAKAREAAD